MSELLLNQLSSMVESVSENVERIDEARASQTEVMLDALDDIAANVMATQAIVAVMLKKVPVDMAEVEAHLKADMGVETVPEKTLAMAKQICQS